MTVGDGVELTGYCNTDTDAGNFEPYIYCRLYERGTQHNSAALTKLVPEGIEFWGARGPNNTNGPYGRIVMYTGSTGYIEIEYANLLIDKSLTVNENIYVDEASIRSQYIYNNEAVNDPPNLYITSNGWFRRSKNPPPYIKYGTVSITPSASNTPTGKAVTFSSSFAGTPNVVISANTSVPGTSVLGVGTAGRSTTGFTAYVTRTNQTETDLCWQAMR